MGSVKIHQSAITNEVQKQVEELSAWCDDVSKDTAEELLRGKPSFTYLIRRGDEKNSFAISFVQEDCSIEHRVFVLTDKGQWYYKNAGDHLERKVQTLIPHMMHCDPALCLPL